MKKLSDHLGLATSAHISNIWLLNSKSGKFLVDTGYYTDRPFLKRALYRGGIRGKGDLQGVLLTHRHSDHSANAAWLRSTFECPVICHADDAPFLTGQSKAKPIFGNCGNFLQKSLCYLEDRFPTQTPIDEVFDSPKWRNDFHVIHTPGHTEGSVMLYHEPSKTLFSGDSILTGLPPFRLVEYFSLAMGVYSDAIESCHNSVKAFIRDMPQIDTICSGHGPWVNQDAMAKLRRLVARGPAPRWRKNWV